MQKIKTDYRIDEMNKIKEARAMLREARIRFYGKDALKEKGIHSLGYDYSVIMGEVEYLQSKQGMYVSPQWSSKVGQSEAKAKGRKAETKKIKQTGLTSTASLPPISSDNKGHRMLQAMGWKEGDKLGTNGSGLSEPIHVVKRAKNLGLGAR